MIVLSIQINSKQKNKNEIVKKKPDKPKIHYNKFITINDYNKLVDYSKEIINEHKKLKKSLIDCHNIQKQNNKIINKIFILNPTLNGLIMINNAKAKYELSLGMHFLSLVKYKIPIQFGASIGFNGVSTTTSYKIFGNVNISTHFGYTWKLNKFIGIGGSINLL